MKDHKALLKAKVDINIKNKNAFKIGNLRIVEKCGLISCVEFKVKVKELLDLYLIIAILSMLCYVIQVFTNNFKCEVLAMHV